MKNFVFSISVLFLAGASSAEPYVYDDRGYRFEATNSDECYGLGTSNPLLSVCLKYFESQSSRKLDDSLKNLQSNLVRDKKQFESAQAKWVEFSELQCQFEAKASEAHAKPYNAYTEIYNTCIENLKSERADYLNQIEVGCAACVK